MKRASFYEPCNGAKWDDVSTYTYQPLSVATNGIVIEKWMIVAHGSNSISQQSFPLLLLLLDRRSVPEELRSMSSWARATIFVSPRVLLSLEYDY